MKYIAYGSNMVEEQMAYRCPNAKLIGTGQLPNHRLEIDAEDEHSLDHYEGFPKYYTKCKRTVLMDDGSRIEGMVYIMNMIRPLIPHASYYNGIHAAYQKLGLSSEIKRVLEPALQRSIERDRRRHR